MHSQDVTWILRLSGWLVAIFIAVSTPLTFAIVSLNDVRANLESTGRLSAGRAARYIFANQRMWEFQRVRLEEVIELPIAEHALYRQSIISGSGGEVYADTHSVITPILTSRQPILVAGKVVGELVIQSSARPVLVKTVWIAAFSSLIALFSLAVVHFWPIRLINRMLSSLASEQERTSIALQDLQTSDEVLKSRSEQLIEAQKLGRIGDWSLNIGNNDLFLSPIIADLLCLDQLTSLPSLPGIKSMLMPGSAAKLERLIADVIRSRSAKTTDVDFRRGDGTIAYLAITCRPVPRDDGRIAEIGGTIQDITERREAAEQLEQLAYFDTLTGLANRALFKRELTEVLDRVAQSDDVAALLLIDLDRFKEVNDSLGHGAGDELLRVVSRALTATLKNRHFIARLGGDEFAIILSEPSDRMRAEAIAREVIEELAKPMVLGLGEVRIGGSIGIVMLPTDGASAEEATRHADLALYRAKDQGRGRFAFFEHEMSDFIQEKMALARDLRIAASDNSGLEAWFQPQINLATDTIAGFEALMRWKHPTRGYVPPGEFIPIAESSSLIMDIGHWMMRESARTAKAWIDAGHPPYEIAVNLSAAQIWQTNIEEDVARVLKETGLPPQLLCIELTESLLADHTEGRVRRALTRLKALGVTLALDDFGTGFSSLGYLIQLPFDKLKIDRIFVSGAATSEKMQHVLQGIIALGHGLGMKVVAEGVEELEELALLKRLGCDQVQGYIFARPAPAHIAITYAARGNDHERQVA